MYLGETWGSTVFYRGVGKGPTGKKPGAWEGVSQVVIAEGGKLQAGEGPVQGPRGGAYLMSESAFGPT